MKHAPKIRLNSLNLKDNETVQSRFGRLCIKHPFLPSFLTLFLKILT